jgi:hypothetical protein
MAEVPGRMEKQARFNLWHAIVAVPGVLLLREIRTTDSRVPAVTGA